MEENSFGGFEELFDAKYTAKGVLFAILDTHSLERHLNDNVVPTNREDRVVGTICIVRGEMRITFDDGSVVCNPRQNNLLFIDPSTTILSIDSTPDLKGFVLLLNHVFMHAYGNIIGLRPKMVVMNPPHNSYTMTEQERQLLVTDYNRLEQYFERESHRFYHQTVILAVLETFCDTLEVICNCNPMMTLEKPVRGRREEICRRFMDLLSENVRSNHDVSFYADRLCITSQYLTKVTKEHFGGTAGQMIDRALMHEAIIMLKSTDMGVAEIADHLSFADGASFSKFFRKHQGCSPVQFRKKS